MTDIFGLVFSKLGDLLSLSSLFVVAVFIVVLSVIVFVHEFGHFIVGRWCGAEAEEFSIGFGREILGWRDRRGTRWKICWLPLGGYVRFIGDANAASMPDEDQLATLPSELQEQSLQAQAVWKRALIIAAGPLANFLFAIVIYSAFFAIDGKAILEPRIDVISQGGRAEAAGLKVGDLILSVDGVRTLDFSDVAQRIVMSAEEPLKLKVDRNGEIISVVATPERKKIKSLIGYVDGGQLGFQVDPSQPGRLQQVSLTIPMAVVEGATRTWQIIDQSISTIGKLVTGKISFNQMSGPLGIAQMTGKVAEQGVLDLVAFAAFLSVSIGMVNLLPIPVLDGGHLVFCLIEAITRRPLNQKVQEFAFRIGFAIIFFVFVMATWGDIVRKFSY